MRRASLIGLAVGLTACGAGGSTLQTPPADQATPSLCYAPVPQNVPPHTGPELPRRKDLTIRSELSGPWRVGVLRVNATGGWSSVPATDLSASPKGEDGPIRATFTVHAGWPHAALPSLSNATGYSSQHPLEVSSADILLPREDASEHTYTVSAQRLPTIDELRAVTVPAPEGAYSQDSLVPDLPRELVAFLATFQGGYWERLDAWRNWVLDNIVAARRGEVSATPASRLAEIFAQRRATPFEIVALQLVGARWMGIPARLVFGYDGGRVAGPGVLTVDTEINSIFYIEVHFGRWGWVPVIGTPRRADGDDC